MSTPPQSTFTIEPSALRSYENKTVLITGGSSGIGLSTASLIASLSQNNNIAILDLSPPPSSLQLPASRILFHKCDITSWASQRAGFEAAYKKWGRIDAVFVNAGIAEYGEQFFGEELDGAGLLKEPDHKTLDIDIKAASDTLKLAIYYLRKNGKEGGSIVMTASLAGYLASAGTPLYSAAKHGIVGLLRALKSEVSHFSLSLSLIAPGITTTPILLQERNRTDYTSPQAWSDHMSSLGVPINTAETVGKVVVWLMVQGKGANGKGILIQKDRCWDFERGLAKGRGAWMGEEMLGLFKGGRDAPLFQRVGGEKVGEGKSKL